MGEDDHWSVGVAMHVIGQQAPARQSAAITTFPSC